MEKQAIKKNEPVSCPPEAGPIDLERCPTFAAAEDFPISSFHPKEGTSEVTHTLKPGEQVNVTYRIGPIHLQFGDKKQFQPRIEADTLAKLRVSTRSFRAQSGVFVYLDEDKPLTQKQVEAITNGEEIEVAGYLKNISQSSQVFKAEDEVGRFYWTNDQELIRGADLQKLLDDGLVGPKDWLLIDDYTVAVKVAQTRFQVPNVSDMSPFRWEKREPFGYFTSWTAPHNKAFENTGLIDPKHPFHLLVTQEKLNLPGNVMGILLPKTNLPGVIHYPSYLIDPLSKWPVRLEILGGHPNYVYFTFYKTDNCPARPASDVATFNTYAGKK